MNTQTQLVSGTLRKSIVQEPLRALDPTAGIARSTNLFFDEQTLLWTVEVDIGLDKYRSPIDRNGVLTVGTTGFERSDVLLRGAGKAVERFALMPSSATGTLIEPAHAQRIDLRGTGRADPQTDNLVLVCETGQRIDTTEVLIPAALIDDPLFDHDLKLFDPSPSGAAAGASFEDAALTSLLESVEQDAVQCAWSLQPLLRRISHDVACKVLRNGTHEGRLLADILEHGNNKFQFVVIPTGVVGLCAVTAFVFEARLGGPVGAGCAVSAFLPDALARAGREAIQVLSLQRRRQGDVRETNQTETQLARATYWVSPDTATTASAWLAHLEPLKESDVAVHCNIAQPDLAELDEALRNEGLDPIVCDLTRRLPAPIQDAGWVAVKAVVLGHQPLRRSNEHSFTWCQARLETWAQRWNCSPQPTTTPHPFI